MVKTVTCHNPYFIGMNLAIGKLIIKPFEGYKSQSLFYWNEPCNLKAIRKTRKPMSSQSLFYWNEPCNKNKL